VAASAGQKHARGTTWALLLTVTPTPTNVSTPENQRLNLDPRTAYVDSNHPLDSLVDSAVSTRWFQGGSGPSLSPMFGGLDSMAVINAPSSDGGSTDPSGYNQEYVLTDASTGGREFFHTFSPLLPKALRGKFIRSADPAGNTTVAAYYGGTGADANKLEALTNTSTTGGVTATQTLSDSYVSTGSSAGMLSGVTLTTAASNVSGGAPVTVQTEEYAYYSGTVPQLETATVKDAAGNVVDAGYYRWYSNTDSDGDGGALKYYFGSDAFARLQAAYPCLAHRNLWRKAA
jgi:hypothetical protein